MGFDEPEMVLPKFAGLALEYQLLVEMFAYPTKHLFFELPVPDGLMASEASEFELFLFFNSSNPRLEAIVGPDSLALNCVPIVNLFEPQSISQNIDQYCVDSLLSADTGSSDFEVFDSLLQRGGYAGVHRGGHSPRHPGDRPGGGAHRRRWLRRPHGGRGTAGRRGPHRHAPGQFWPRAGFCNGPGTPASSWART